MAGRAKVTIPDAPGTPAGSPMPGAPRTMTEIPNARRNQTRTQVTDGLAGRTLLPGDPLEGIADGYVHPSKLGERIFHSAYKNHVIQVDSPPPMTDIRFPGRVTFPKSTIMKFTEGEFRTTDPKLIAFIEGDESQDPPTAPMRGYGIIVWDAIARQNAEAKQEVIDFKNKLARNPRLLKELKQELSAGDFAVLQALANRDAKDRAAAAAEADAALTT